jgi:hypothetical protein
VKETMPQVTKVRLMIELSVLSLTPIWLSNDNACSSLLFLSHMLIYLGVLLISDCFQENRILIRL